MFAPSARPCSRSSRPTNHSTQPCNHNYERATSNYPAKHRPRAHTSEASPRRPDPSRRDSAPRSANFHDRRRRRVRGIRASWSCQHARHHQRRRNCNRHSTPRERDNPSHRSVTPASTPSLPKTKLRPTRSRNNQGRRQTTTLQVRRRTAQIARSALVLPRPHAYRSTRSDVTDNARLESTQSCRSVRGPCCVAADILSSRSVRIRVSATCARSAGLRRAIAAGRVR